MINDNKVTPKAPVQIQLSNRNIKPGTLVITVLGETYKDDGKGRMQVLEATERTGTVDYGTGFVSLNIGTIGASYKTALMK